MALCLHIKTIIMQNDIHSMSDEKSYFSLLGGIMVELRDNGFDDLATRLATITEIISNDVDRLCNDRDEAGKLLLMTQVALHSGWRQLVRLENRTEQQETAISLIDHVLIKVQNEKIS